MFEFCWDPVASVVKKKVEEKKKTTKICSIQEIQKFSLADTVEMSFAMCYIFVFFSFFNVIFIVSEDSSYEKCIASEKLL